MRHYFEVAFQPEYFPYWEFTMLMMLLMQLSMIWRLHRIENKMDDLMSIELEVLDEVEK